MTPPADIATWLESHGLTELAPVFEANAITPEVLTQLSEDDFREMGITALGHRKKLLSAVKALQAPAMAETRETAGVSARSPSPQPSAKQVPSVASKPQPPRPSSALPAPVAAVEALPPADPSTKPKRKGWSASFLGVSIALHLVFGLGAGYWVVQQIQAKRKLQFSGGPPTASPSKRALEHKVSLQKRKNAGGAPAQARRIAVSGMAANITLPDMPAMPNASTQFVTGRMSGMGGAGFGSGLGFGNGSGMGVGGMGKGGLGLTMFGARGGAGLIGTFYDLKRDADGKPNGINRGNRGHYTKVLKEFTSGATWKMPASLKCYTGKSKLVSKAFLFPAIEDTEAGAAFEEKETGAGMWIAHYGGSVKVPVTGKYRFVGWGDNLLAVRFGSKIVLDASDIGYLRDGDNRQPVGPVSFPKKGSTPCLAGSWINMKAGEMVRMDVLLGDEGGIYCAGLLLEKEGDEPKKGKGSIPALPLFLVAPLSNAEKKLYDNWLDDSLLRGPVFNAMSATSMSPLDLLKK